MGWTRQFALVEPRTSFTPHQQTFRDNQVVALGLLSASMVDARTINGYADVAVDVAIADRGARYVAGWSMVGSPCR